MTLNRSLSKKLRKSKKRRSSLLLRCIRNKYSIALVTFLGAGFVLAFYKSDGTTCVNCSERKEISLKVTDAKQSPFSTFAEEGEKTLIGDEEDALVLLDQEDENLRLMLQRDIRLKTQSIKAAHLVVDKEFRCNVIISSKKNLVVDDCGEDYLAKRIVENELEKVNGKNLFRQQGFKSVDSVSITVGNFY